MEDKINGQVYNSDLFTSKGSGMLIKNANADE